MTRTERLLRLARLRGDRAAELILSRAARGSLPTQPVYYCPICRKTMMVSWLHRSCGTNDWTEAELRAAWGDR